MSDWDDYLAAARRLDTVRRQAASVAAAGTDTVRAAREELATVRQRLDRQRSLLLALAGAPGPVPPTGAPNGAGPGSEAGAGAGSGTVPDGYRLAGSALDAGGAGDAPLPEPGGSQVPGSTSTTAGDADRSTATGDTDAMDLPGLRALRAANAQLDAADAILSGLGHPPPAGNRPPVRRNALVYGSFAVVVLAVQLTLFGTLKDTVASMVATAAGAVLPLVGFGLSWLLISLLFGGRGRRTGAGGPYGGTPRKPRAAGGPFAGTPDRPRAAPDRVLRLPGLLRHAGRRVLAGRPGDGEPGGGRDGDGRGGDGRGGDGRDAGSGHVPHASPDVPSLDPRPRVETGDSGPGRVDRTPLLGAAISLAPVVVLCAGLGAAALLR